MRLEPVYGPLCDQWEDDLPLDIQEGCAHDSCWFTATWGQMTRAPQPPEPVIKQAIPKERYL